MSTVSSTGTTLDWLAGYRFTGDIWGYGEGDVYFPGSPLLVVESTFAEAVVLETLLLSILNHDSAVASAASRMIGAAEGRPCIEMGSRRTHEWAAVAAARAAYICGFATTSNLQAGLDYGVPTAGTAAHSFTLLHDAERDAFAAQVESLGSGTTLLVDTYDVREAVKTAVDVAGTSLGAVRLDSGDLGELAQQVRRQLDDLGATKTRIIVTSDLDEYAISGLAAAPVDGYGVGTSLVTGSGHPTCGFVYKLVARADSMDDDAGCAPSRRRAPTRSRSAAASGRCAGETRPARHRSRSSGSVRRRRTTVTTDRCCVSWSGAARSSVASPSRRPAAARRCRRQSCPSMRGSSPAANPPSRPSTSAAPLTERSLTPGRRIAVRHLASRVEP